MSLAFERFGRQLQAFVLALLQDRIEVRPRFDDIFIVKLAHRRIDGNRQRFILSEIFFLELEKMMIIPDQPAPLMIYLWNIDGSVNRTYAAKSPPKDNPAIARSFFTVR